MADIPLKSFRPQRPLAGGHALLVQAQGLLAAGGVFGQQDVGVGAVGADGQGLVRKLHLSLLVGLPEGPVHERLGLAERRALLGHGHGAEGVAVVGCVRGLFERAQVFAKAEKLVEKYRARAEAVADDVQPGELRELLYYLVDSVLDRQPPAPETGAPPLLQLSV